MREQGRTKGRKGWFSSHGRDMSVRVKQLNKEIHLGQNGRTHRVQ